MQPSFKEAGRRTWTYTLTHTTFKKNQSKEQPEEIWSLLCVVCQCECECAYPGCKRRKWLWIQSQRTGPESVQEGSDKRRKGKKKKERGKKTSSQAL